jgi:hypothetical protein
VFRVLLQEDGGPPLPALILVERREGRLEAMLLIDLRVSLLRVVCSDERTLRAELATEHGASELSITITDATVAGTLTAKKHVWRVRGERSL